MPPEKLQTPSILVQSNTAKTICIILLHLGPIFFLVVIHCINPVRFLESESQLCLCILEIRSSINLCFLEIRISTFLFILEFGSSMSLCFLEFWNSKLDQSLRSGTWIGRSSICLCVLEFEEVWSSVFASKLDMAISPSVARNFLATKHFLDKAWIDASHRNHAVLLSFWSTRVKLQFLQPVSRDVFVCYSSDLVRIWELILLLLFLSFFHRRMLNNVILLGDRFCGLCLFCLSDCFSVCRERYLTRERHRTRVCFLLLLQCRSLLCNSTKEENVVQECYVIPSFLLKFV